MTDPEPKRIPNFASLEEEAQFWDTHDTADFEEEFAPAQVRVSRRLGITVRLDSETLGELRERARRQGIGPTTLIRMWVLDRLRQEQEKSAHS